MGDSPNFQGIVAYLEQLCYFYLQTLLNERASTMQTSAVIDIQQPVATVWAYVSDLRHMADWVDGVSDVQFVGDPSLRVGQSFTSKYTYSGKTHTIKYEVTEIVPEQRIGRKSTEGPFPFDGVLSLQATAQGTQLTNTLDVGSDSKATTIMFTLLGPIMRWFMAKQLRKELTQLKHNLEHA